MAMFGLMLKSTHDAHVKTLAVSVYERDKIIAAQKAELGEARDLLRTERSSFETFCTQLRDVVTKTIKAISADYNSGRVPPSEKTKLREAVTNNISSVASLLDNASAKLKSKLNPNG
jgi:hypothetical protein